MSVAYSISIDDLATPALRKLIDSLDGTGQTALNRIGAQASVEGAQDYHRQFDAAGGWFNQGAPTWGPGRTRTQWPRDVTRAWGIGDVGRSEAIIVNAHPHYRFKVFGGVVRGNPWLTIPIDPRAHGRNTKQFERHTGFKLFRPRGRDVLMFVEVKGTPAKVAFALKRSITHHAWPGALPVDDVFLDPFIQAVAREVGRAF